MGSTRTRVIALVLLAALLGLVPLWCSRREPPVVQTAHPVRAPLRVVVSTNGRIEPVDDLEIRARLDGRVEYIPDPGKRVAAGDVVVRLDAGPVAGQLAAAESERLSALESLRAARANAAERRARLATDRQLAAEGALLREVLEQSERAAREAEAQVEHLAREVPLRVAALDARIAELRAQQEAAVVRAPIAGTIYRTAVKTGAMVRLGDPLLWLADLEQLRVRANVDQVDLGRVQPGQPVRVSANAFPGRLWRGTISEVVPDVIVKESRAVSESLARIEPPVDGLVPGMTVDVEIIVAEAPDALQVPAEAVRERDGQSLVYRVDGRRVRETAVTTGLSSVSAVAVTSGLDPDDLIVVGPLEGLHDGMRVVPQQRDGARAGATP